MSFKFLFFILFVNVVLSSASLNDEIELERESVGPGNAPFFELPCMVVGGVCARSVACPKGTKVTVKGLCPVQQDLGMECCRTMKQSTCKLKGGECLSPRDFRCPRSLHVGVVTDCNADQVCCVYV